MGVLNRLARAASTALKDVARTAVRDALSGRGSGGGRGSRGGRGSGGSRTGSPGTRGREEGRPGTGGEAAGQAGAAPRTTVEFHGDLPPLRYEPRPDDLADPGEVVWAWVPYEEDDGRGKDRPVLVLARHGGGVLALQATSKDHERDRADEARWGRRWFDIGSGGWDSQGRESEVRLDRVLLIPTHAVRREGAGLARDRFDAVVRALLDHRAGASG